MDLNLKYRLGTGRLVKKRDRAYGEISYNNRFLELYEHELDLRRQKKLNYFEIESKKRLLPLEKQAISDAVVNSEIRA